MAIAGTLRVLFPTDRRNDVRLRSLDHRMGADPFASLARRSAAIFVGAKLAVREEGHE